MLKFNLAIVFVLFVSANPVFSSDWIPVKNSSYKINNKSVHKDDDGHVRFLMSDVSPPSNDLKEKYGEKFSYSIIEVAVDCNEFVDYLIQVDDYDKNDEIIGHLTWTIPRSNDASEGKWSRVVSTACKAYDKKIKNNRSKWKN